MEADHATLFERLADLTGYTRSLEIARPEDILREEGAPGPDGRQRVRFAIREGAITTRIEIRALTDKEREACQRIVDSVTPPPVTKDEYGPDGKLKSRVHAGYDEDSPEFRARFEAARLVQKAHIALLGCPTLKTATPGDSLDAKVAALRDKIDANLTEFIAASVWNLGYTGADAADFFSATASDSTPD